jgi:phosphate:Na+ symporter
MFDGWKFLAGLGIFLFGMFMMEESIRLLAGRSLKTLIRRFTGTRIKALCTGIFSTALLQSSSAVSLMVLAFVGAGLLTLNNAVAVTMGAMVGTTLTAWIVAVLGFSFKIDTLALPMIGLGGLGLIILGKSARYVNVSKLLAAFGFLFLGLDYMKSSVEALAGAIDLGSLPNLGLWVYILAGTVLTAVMQSSSAAIAVVLTTLFAGVIDFGQAAAMVIGANVGTTVTILIGAIGGIPAKKQTAFSSLIFNTGTALVMLPALPLAFWIIGRFFDPTQDAVLGIAAFHTLFNLVGVVLFFPAIPVLVRYLERIFPEKRNILSRFIHNTSPQLAEAAVAALRNEVFHQLALSIGFIADRYRLNSHLLSSVSGRSTTPAQAGTTLHYRDLEQLHAEIFSFYARMQAHSIEEPEALQLEPVIRSNRSIMNATKNLFELLPEIEDIGRDGNPFMDEAYRGFKERLEGLIAQTVKVVQVPDDESIIEELNGFFQSVDAADKRFIRLCAQAVSKGMIREHEVTRLLMVNRFFTQSNRMVVLSMHALTRGFSFPEKRFHFHNHNRDGY